MFLHQHAAALAAIEGLDIIVTAPALYAAPVAKKYFIRPDEKALAVAQANKLDVKFFGDILKKYKGQKTKGLYRSGDLVAVYMNGGGTTGVSRTIMLSSTALNAVTKNALGAATLCDYKAGELSKILALPFFHAYGLVAGLLTTMVSGWKSIPMARFEADEYITYLKANKCYEIVGVPNMFRKLLNHPDFAGEHLKYVKYAFAGRMYEFSAYNFGHYVMPLYTLTMQEASTGRYVFSYIHRQCLTKDQEVYSFHDGVVRAILAGVKSPDKTIGKILEEI